MKVGRGDCHLGGCSRRDTGDEAHAAHSWSSSDPPYDRLKDSTILNNQDQEIKPERFNLNVYIKLYSLLAPHEPLPRIMV